MRFSVPVPDENGWIPGRWYRLRTPDGKLWMETSDREEVMEEARRTGYPLQRQYRREEMEWRLEPVVPEEE